MTPFSPAAASTVNVAVTASPQNLAVPSAGGWVGPSQLILTNIGTQTVFVRWDGVAATTGNAMPLLANTQVTVTIASSVAQLSVIAAATGSTLYATLGTGE